MQKNDRKKFILPTLINPNSSFSKTPIKSNLNTLLEEQISTNHTYFNSDAKNNSNSSNKISSYYVFNIFFALRFIFVVFLFF